MTTTDAVVAAHRFGLGPRPGELMALASGTRDRVAAQIAAGPRPIGAVRELPDTRARLALVAEPGISTEERQMRLQQLGAEVIGTEYIALAREKVVTPAPFAERMVAFWANHFTVINQKGYTRAIATAYLHEAIRPNVFGRFADLLFAAETHPAMLIYLDNALSVGPNSPLGQRRARDINENQAREILELHTLGVDGGYTQEDIIALAKAMTGWTYDDPRYARALQRIGRRVDGLLSEEIGQATFVHVLHEPGAKTILGKTYREAGPEEFRAVCEDLAAHPSTARFLATKLARHFVADDPPEAAVTAIEKAYKESDGDLAEVSRAIVGLDAAWAVPFSKVKSPQDYVVAGYRALGAQQVRLRAFDEALTAMGQRVLRAPSPQGWPDTAAAWAAPGSIMARIEFARGASASVGGRIEPSEFLRRTLGELASEETERLVAGAPSGEEAVAFILASKEFQRR